MKDDDPFAFDDADDDRTVLHSRSASQRDPSTPSGSRDPAGRGAANERRAGSAAEASTDDIAALERQPLLGGVNALERAASRLLPLLVSIRQSRDEPDVPRLRDRLVRELELFKRHAREALDEPAQVTQASYVLCTAIDEAVMQTPWGHRANWAQHSLLEAFHNEVTGGERFFSLLKSLGREPDRNRPVLELMYVLLALGYEGSYRLARDGQATLTRVREWLYAVLVNEGEARQRALSPHWEGSAVGERTLPRFAGAGLAALVALGIAVAAWVTLRIDTGARAERTIERFWSLRPVAFSSASIAAPAPRPRETNPDTPPRPSLVDLLATDIAAGAVVVDDSDAVGHVRIVGDALFASGRADVAPEVLPLLARVARALGQFDGDIVVTGHTDGVPIRSGRWASNLELSLARAEAVRTEFASALPPGQSLRAEGRGSLERLTDDSTPALRRVNRRVDVTVEYR